MPLDPVETLKRLIQTPSVNPMGRDCTGPAVGESRMSDLIEAICREQGWPCRRQNVHPGRDNVLVLVKGDPLPENGGELLLWDVHQDTVSADGMRIDPFAGEVRDCRLYGRGASDVKGSMAAMLAALSRLGSNSPTPRPTILLACTANEECGFTGARRFADELAATPQGPERSVEGRTSSTSDDRFFTTLPHAAIVGEPTDFNVIVAHQGQVRWRCHTVGSAAHTSRPDLGINAIYAMAQIVQAIERFHRELSSSGPEHVLCGRPSACVSTITGGVGINTVPERATIGIDRRLGPSESLSDAYQQLIDYIAKYADVGRCSVEHDPPFMQSLGLSEANNREFAERLTSVVCMHGRNGAMCGAPYGTDAAAISTVGIPTVVFGPGSIDQAHTADEFIAVSELELATEIFYDIACKGLRRMRLG